MYVKILISIQTGFTGDSNALFKMVKSSKHERIVLIFQLVVCKERNDSFSTSSDLLHNSITVSLIVIRE